MAKLYWYCFIHQECPVCGAQDNYKVRRYGPKPKNMEDRHEHGLLSCNCLM